jgi:hypothetical protein
MTILTTSTFTANIPQVPYITPPPPPAPTFIMPEPISYEFQVVEFIQDDKVTKVALQIKQNTHDQYGNIKTHGTWQDVPRVKINL